MKADVTPLTDPSRVFAMYVKRFDDLERPDMAVLLHAGMNDAGAGARPDSIRNQYRTAEVPDSAIPQRVLIFAAPTGTRQFRLSGVGRMSGRFAPLTPPRCD